MATAVEYGLIASLIAIGIVAGSEATGSAFKSTSSETTKPQKPTTITVGPTACKDGAMEYDFAANRLTIKNQVCRDALIAALRK